MKYLKKTRGGPKKAQDPLSVTDKDFLVNYPALFEYLTVVEWKAGEPRIPLTLRLFVDEGRWKVCLTDREEGRVCFLSGDSLEGVLLFADEQLREDTCDWRPDKFAKPRKGKSA